MSYDPHQPYQPDPSQQPPVASGPPYQQPYPPQQYGAPPPGQPYGYVPQPPPKKRKVWPWVVGGVVAVMILGCVGVFAIIGAGGKAVSDSLKEADQNQQGKNAVAGQFGKPITDGKFQFTVTGMKCGLETVGPDGFSEKAQGQFCVIDTQIKNVGKSAEVFNDSSQKAYDAKEVEYSVDTGAGIWANKEYSTFLEEINPGNTVKGKLVFDVPAGTKLTSVVLHESMFTAGVKIPLK